MGQLRPVSRREKILFPIICTVVTGLILPTSVPLVGMLMFGNQLRKCGATDRLSLAAQNEILNITTIFLGLAVGATMETKKTHRRKLKRLRPNIKNVVKQINNGKNKSYEKIHFYRYRAVVFSRDIPESRRSDIQSLCSQCCGNGATIPTDVYRQ